MSQQPRIEDLPERMFIGMRVPMSFAANTTGELWRAFMPRRREVPDAVEGDLFSLAVYPPGFFDAFDPQRSFEKWAALETTSAQPAPPGMAVIIVSGLYAVFVHKGPASEGPRTFGYIFGTWLPASPYVVDQRPHFEVMAPGYRPDDPNAEEELWVPVREPQATR